ncbi:MAG: hypothetical protein PHN78_05570 [Dehalococcoidales bacterium]|nr:hypothetical protein [Dehalococcoidales bacterium]
MFDKEYSDTAVKEKMEMISYQPGLQDSGDLETGTRTITATAEASGLVNADYSASLTLSPPADARLVVKRICARLQVTIDTIPSGDTDLYCRVYVDAQAAANRLFDLNWNSTGAKLSAVDTYPANLAAIFDLLKNGSSHTFYFFFWKVGTGTGIVISLVQLWEGVGSSLVGAGTTILAFDLVGLAGIVARAAIGGMGSSDIRLSAAGSGGYGHFVSGTTTVVTPCLVMKNVDLTLNTNTTDSIAVLDRMYVNVRSEQ